MKRGVFGIEFSHLLPHIDAITAFDRMRNSQTLSETAFTGGTFVNFYNSGFDTNWEIDLFGKLRDRARAAAYDVVAQREEVRNVHLSIVSEVAKHYFAIRTLQERIRITRKHIESEGELAELTQSLFDAGFISDLDVRLSKALLNQRLANLPQFEILLWKSIYSTAVLLGEIPEMLLDTFSDEPVPLCTDGKIPLGLPSELLCRRGDVRQAEFLMRASGARVLAARKELFPTLSLNGFYQFATGFYSNWFNFDSHQWSILPGLSLPVFQGGRILSRIATDTSKQRQAALEYEKIVLIALQEMETSLNAYFREGIRLQALEAEVSEYSAARDLSAVLYESGLVDFLYVIDTEKDLYDAEVRLAGSKELLMTSLVAVYKALGGGWECSSLP